MILKNKISISIFIIWLFNISGILGILSTYSDWFLKLTPINLSMYVILILWNIDDFSKKVLVAFSIPFVIGFLTEFLGVNFGLIFGSYSYGDNLGLKIWWSSVNDLCELGGVNYYYSRSKFINS